MIELWPFQNEVMDETREALRSHKSVLIQSPTGSGKTQIASKMLETVSKRDKLGFFICHRRELVDQTADTFERNGIHYGFIAATYPKNYYQKIQICSIDTLKNRVENLKLDPSFIIWDEAHHLGAAGWARVKAAYPNAYHVGLSATPKRLDGTGLDSQFDYLVQGKQVHWLIEQGYLAEYKLFSVPGVDLTGVHTKMGDYVKGESEKAMDKPKITGDIIDHWRRIAAGRRTIGFAVTVRHSKRLAALFNQAGIPAAHLDGETAKVERREKLRDLATGRLQVVFNVGLFGEGYDIASNSGVDGTVIECVIDAAPTQSLGAYLQRCGRALRKQPGHSIILDHAGNAMRHGLPCDERYWSLDGRVRSERSDSDTEPTVSVIQCQSCYYVYQNSPACPNCGHVNEGRKIKEVAGELEEIDPATMRRQHNMEMRKQQSDAQTIEDLRKLAEDRGINPAWADKVAAARDEKNRLRTSVLNLIVGLDTVNIHHGLSHRMVISMKPKKLKETILELEKLLKGAA